MAAHFHSTILQKWFVGLCVHAMPFASLLEVFEAFLSEGYIFLFKLSLAIVETVADRILATNSAEVNKLFELLRLDSLIATFFGLLLNLETV